MTSEPLETKSDLISAGRAAVTSINYKIAIFMFSIFIFLSSDIFINRVLGRINHATAYDHPTNYGTVLSGIFLSLAYLAVDVLSRADVL